MRRLLLLLLLLLVVVQHNQVLSLNLCDSLLSPNPRSRLASIARPPRPGWPGSAGTLLDT